MNKYSIVLMLGIAVTAVAVCSPVRSMLGSNGNEFSSEEWNPTAADYIQDGLVALWDGIENVGYGLHEDNPSAWISLVNPVDSFRIADISKYFTPVYSIEDDHFHVTKIAIWNPPRDSASYGETWGSFEVCFAFNGVDNSYIPSRIQICKGTSNSAQGLAIYREKISDEENRYGILLSYSSKACIADFTDYIGRKCTVSLKYSNASNQNNSRINGKPFAFASGFNNTGSDAGWGFGYRGKNATIGNWTTAIDTSGYIANTDIYCIRLYNRALTDAEIRYNYLIDKLRFNLP